jgi:hypothetical protein
MKRLSFLPAFLLFLLALPFIAQAAHPESALGVLNDLPARYRSGVVWVSADNADPHPDTWYVTARNSARDGLLMNLTVSRGEIISERPAISPRAFLRQITPIAAGSVRVNSTDLWREALRFSDRRGQNLGSMSLQLQQHGRDATPIWSVWCYDRRGGYIGYFSALATTGAITSRR